MEKQVEAAACRAVGGFFPLLSVQQRRAYFIILFLIELFILQCANHHMQGQADPFQTESHRK